LRMPSTAIGSNRAFIQKFSLRPSKWLSAGGTWTASHRNARLLCDQVTEMDREGRTTI
jgi:hypothetical protein